MKRIYTPEQKAKAIIENAKWRANRLPEKVAEDKAKQKIVNARCLANRTLEKVAEHKARDKTSRDLLKANRSPEQIIEDKAKSKAWNANFYKENPEYSKEHNHKHDLGYFAVYAIDDYIGTGDAYCGQTGNLYNRMATHKKVGRINTGNHRILGCFRTREQALAFEAIQHEAGYHGYNNGH